VEAACKKRQYQESDEEEQEYVGKTSGRGQGRRKISCYDRQKTENFGGKSSVKRPTLGARTAENKTRQSFRSICTWPLNEAELSGAVQQYRDEIHKIASANNANV